MNKVLNKNEISSRVNNSVMKAAGDAFHRWCVKHTELLAQKGLGSIIGDPKRGKILGNFCNVCGVNSSHGSPDHVRFKNGGKGSKGWNNFRIKIRNGTDIARQDNLFINLCRAASFDLVNHVPPHCMYIYLYFT